MNGEDQGRPAPRLLLIGASRSRAAELARGIPGAVIDQDEDLTRFAAGVGQDGTCTVIVMHAASADADRDAPPALGGRQDAVILVLLPVADTLACERWLDAGATYVLSTSVSARILCAYVRQALRIAATQQPRSFIVGGCLVELESRTLRHATSGSAVLLANLEARLLVELVRAGENGIAARLLAQRIWMVEEDIESNALVATVTRLRRKLEQVSCTLGIARCVDGLYRLLPTDALTAKPRSGLRRSGEATNEAP